MLAKHILEMLLEFNKISNSYHTEGIQLRVAILDTPRPSTGIDGD